MHKLLEKAALFAVLLFATGVGSAIYIGVGQDVSKPALGGVVLIELFFGVFYILFSFLVVKQHKIALLLIYKEKWLAALCILTFTSMLWSIDPFLTLRRSLALLGTTVVGLYMGMHLEPKQQLKLVGLCVGIAAIASLITALAFPTIGIQPDGQWQGAFYLKNALGRIMVLGAFCFTFLAIGERRNRWLYMGMLGLCSVLLLLSRSATAIVVFLLVFALFAFRKILTWPNRVLIPLLTAGFLVSVSGAMWVIRYPEMFLDVLGRDVTLTGRIPLWQLVMQEIAARPILGFGYSAFWSSAEADRLRATLNWAAPNAHNGFLEITLGIGLIGTILLAIGIFNNLARALQVIRSHAGIENSWPFFFVILTVVYNFTESSMLGANTILWILYAANSFWLVRARTSGEQVKPKQESAQDYLADYQAAPS